MCRTYHRLFKSFKSCLIDGYPFPLEICVEHGGKLCRQDLKASDKLLIKPTRANELLNFMNYSRTGQPRTLIFSGSICTPSLSMIYPQKGTRGWKKVNLSIQGNYLCFCSNSCTKSRCC